MWRVEALKMLEVEQESTQWMVANHAHHILMFDIFIFNSISQKTVILLVPPRPPSLHF